MSTDQDYYLVPDDTIEVEYEVSVTPAPADRSEATLFRHEAGSEPLETFTLQLQGTGSLSVPLTQRTIEDSPLWLRFTFEKEGATPPSQDVDRAFSLAEPGVHAVAAPADAKVGDSLQLSIGEWAALAYDQPGQATAFPGLEAGRVAQTVKDAVRWTVGGTASDSTGEQLTLTVEEAHLGTTIEVGASTKEGAPQATAQVVIPRLTIVRQDGQAAPAELDFGASTPLRLQVEPDIEGEVEWSCESDKVTLTPEAHDLTLEATTETAEGEELTLTARLTSAATGTVHEATHTFRIVKRVVELFFQKSPAYAEGDDRGIEGLEWQARAGTEVIQSGTTDASGLVEMLFRGDETTLELLSGGAVVGSYRVTRRADPYEDATAILGWQRRLRTLGYHLGAAGPDGNGVDGDRGARTDAALLAFQADRGQEFDGVIGSATRAELVDIAGA